MRRKINHHDDDVVHIGERNVFGGTVPFGLSRGDRRQHIYAIGKSGVGKTSMLRNLILQDIEAGRGIALVDPHGDLAHDLLDHIPPWRSDDVVYFNPSDFEHPPSFNLLARVPSDRRHLVASGIVSAFKSIWRESWGPRLEYILYASIAALLECENTSLLGIQRMLVDARYREWMVGQVTDPAVRAFWISEFAGYDARFLAEVISPVQNKIGQLLMAAPIRNILSQVRSKIDPRFIIDNHRIFIANLSKGLLGEDKANLLGAILITQFYNAAMARADIPEEEREDFSLVVDEFHNFSTDTFASILAESRKYHLGLVLSNQHTAQLRPEVRDAVFGNVGTVISFRVGEADARLLEREFGNTYLSSTFTDLSNYEICVKVLQDGQSMDPFLGRTLPPVSTRYGRRDNLIRRSRERYTTPRRIVEDKVRRWMNP